MVTVPVPLTAAVDLALGGRWTSLAGGGREWLWSRPDPARATVVPGAEFVDAGGLEECLPTVRGLPDHGDVWSRPWRGSPAESVVQGAGFELLRRVGGRAGAVVADYRLSADPGYAFVWAAHALLDVGDDARLLAPEGATARVYPEAAALLDRRRLAGPPGLRPDDRAGWPADAPYLSGHWPAPLGLPLGRFGPDDGTAVGAVLRCAAVRVVDGPDVLALRLEAPGEVPVSTALWRNLGGYPADAPYRSIGVEPMLGAVFDLAEAGPGDAAVVPASGELTWRLVLAAERRIDD
ncbi:hypothetical protein Sme01_25810 [Sphaerisporangium melleum]|uniref:Galactose mutarotase-like enzyme n=1 Tax=Sphaerisporangium melleum TaxID=321316 RepID=A0A917QRJ9_9ACTN|nr:hypothetical protein [Sphaerisporangium melleum]GGK64292.1 hypothetical protein GCM10007964_04130 [Sphaerisporangium melleum]GII70105.1 hypothetical protein Sme01_25810 [Sphaerisporangium melleum]